MKLPFARRRPIAVSVHTDVHTWDGEPIEHFVTTLVMNDGSVWRYNEEANGGWRCFYRPGDEE